MTESGNASREGALHLGYVLYAPPDKAFRALTDPELIAQWSGGRGAVSPEVNGHFELFDGWVTGKVQAFEPGKKLSFTWKPTGWDKKTPPSLVVLRFEEHAAGTELIIEHTGFPNPEETKKHHSGWIDHVLEPLNDHFAFSL